MNPDQVIIMMIRRLKKKKRLNPFNMYFHPVSADEISLGGIRNLEYLQQFSIINDMNEVFEILRINYFFQLKTVRFIMGFNP